MSAISIITAKYKRAAENVAANRLEHAVLMAMDAFALVADRVQNEGIGADGVKFPLYSKKMMPYWLINPSNYNSAGKVERFKKKARSGKNDGSYDAHRS